MKILAIAGALLLVTTSLCPAATYVVRPDGTGDFPTIQAAVDAALDGDIIELTDGVFTGEGNRNVRYLGKAITVRSQGGHAASCIIDCEGVTGLERRAFIFRDGESHTSTLESVTIRNGSVEASWPPGRGGAVACRNGSSPFIRNCTFSSCRADVGGAIGAGSSEPRVEDCTFVANRAGAGGAIAGVSIIRDCVFIGNQAEDGGAVFDCTTVLECDFERNTCLDFGSAINAFERLDVIRDCRFNGNQAGIGAVYLYQGQASILACTFDGNSGGCVYTEYAHLEVAGSRFVGNDNGLHIGGRATVLECQFEGNHNLWAGSAGVYLSGASGRIEHCSFVSNSAPRGGAIGMTDVGTVEIESCIFIDCTARGTGGGGIGAHCQALTIDHCTFAGCSAASGSSLYVEGPGSISILGTIMAFSTSGDAVACSGTPDFDLRCCDIFGNVGGDWTGCIAGQYGVSGNVSEDPLFCDASAGDLTIDSESPCAPAHSGGCGLIGALPVGCGTTAVEMATWGAIKRLFR